MQCVKYHPQRLNTPDTSTAYFLERVAPHITEVLCHLFNHFKTPGTVEHTCAAGLLAQSVGLN